MIRILKSQMFWLLIIILVVIWFFKLADNYPSDINLDAKEDFWGLTYSDKFAEEMGLDWQEVYLAILDDLEVKNIRIPIYWDQIEQTEGEYDFSRYDFIFDEGKKRNVKFIANVGWRLPRWPECHTPLWLKNKTVDLARAKNLEMLDKVVRHFQDREEIVYWQVENEPLFNWFGECPKGDRKYLQTEIDLVKKIDDTRPIIISASGELASWKQEGQMADIFGTTVYRIVWNPIFKYVKYPIPDWFYRAKARFYNIDKNNTIISELQTEPWVPQGTLADLDFKEYDKSFSVSQFKANMQFAINVDFKQAYMWGVEWWYLQKTRGNTQYWDVARSVFNNAK